MSRIDVVKYKNILMSFWYYLGYVNLVSYSTLNFRLKSIEITEDLHSSISNILK